MECGICFEEYQEGDLELHRQTCVLRLIFRCTLCNEDYMSKEGLWNHLDLHEIVDESKELHSQEIKAKHKLHHCVLCNDQRAYSVNFYKKHVHDVHGDFILRSSDCEEKNRSEEQKNDHALSRCERDQTAPMELGNMISDAEHLKQSPEEQTNCAYVELGDCRSRDDDTDGKITEKESEVPTIIAKSKESPSRFACDVCGTTFIAKHLLDRHKRAKYSCMEGRQETCLHCRRRFRMNEYPAHLSICVKRKFSCELCPMKFGKSMFLGVHMRKVHRSTDKNDLTDENVQLRIENLSSALSDLKCSHCGKKFASNSCLRSHILQCHQPTKCSICGIFSEGTSKARYHKKREHTKPSFECAICPKKFYTLTSFKRHSAQHPKRRDISNHKNSSHRTLDDRSDLKATAKNPSDIRSNEHSVADLSDDDESMDTQVIEKEFPMVSSATLSDSSGRQVVSEQTSQSPVEKLSNQPYSCDICGITMHSYYQMYNHKITKHTEAKFQCPHCSKKFHYKKRFEVHVPYCADLKYLCELCDRKFSLLSTVYSHMKRIHGCSRPITRAEIDGPDCPEEKRRNSAENSDEAQMFSGETTNVPLDVTNDVQLDIKVEETMLQEQDNQISNKPAV